MRCVCATHLLCTLRLDLALPARPRLVALGSQEGVQALGSDSARSTKLSH